MSNVTSLANSSALSLPLFPEWPLIHEKNISLDVLCSSLIIFLTIDIFVDISSKAIRPVWIDGCSFVVSTLNPI